MKGDCLLNSSGVPGGKALWDRKFEARIRFCVCVVDADHETAISRSISTRGVVTAGAWVCVRVPGTLSSKTPTKEESLQTTILLL